MALSVNETRGLTMKDPPQNRTEDKRGQTVIPDEGVRPSWTIHVTHWATITNSLLAGGPAVLTFEAIYSGYRTTGFHFSRLF